MSDVQFTLALAGDVATFTASVKTEVQQAIATQAGVDRSAVTITVTSGSVVLEISIRVPTSTATSVQSTIATATSTPSSATAMLSSVSSVAITVTAITVAPTLVPVAAVNPAPASASTGLDGGAIFGIVLGVLTLCACIAVAVLYKLKKLPEKLQSKISNKVAPGR